MNIEEVRLANQRLQAYIKGVNDGVDDRELEVSIYGEQCLDIATELQCDEALLLTWANDELARRDAEATERELPITAELCKALGAVVTSPTFAFFRIPDGHNVNVYLDPIDPHVAYGSNSFPAVTTRGQLLDLLAALNGGA